MTIPNADTILNLVQKIESTLLILAPLQMVGASLLTILGVRRYWRRAKGAALILAVLGTWLVFRGVLDLTVMTEALSALREAVKGR